MYNYRFVLKSILFMLFNKISNLLKFNKRVIFD